MAQLLIESGFDPNVDDVNGRTPLHECHMVDFDNEGFFPLLPITAYGVLNVESFEC